ncbi:MAG: hypothetical protein ACI9ON_001261 [Limisphaerales bacterium]|jgi:uncharacterized protein YcbX
MSTEISSLYRYPIKSMGGHSLDSTSLDLLGLPGDRCWAVRDEERGGIKGGKRFATLMNLSASLNTEPSTSQRSPEATITLQDGSTVLTSDEAVNDALSQAVGSPLSLWPLLPKEALEHYLRTPNNPDQDPEEGLREVFGRTKDEPLPDLSTFPAELMTYESPPGTYFDAFPLLVMSQASLDSMQQASDTSTFDVRRFRPNIVMKTEESGFPEEAWAGKTAKLGSATIRFDMVCPRCVMTTHGFSDLPKDPKIMRQLVQQNGGNLGVYASVVEPGHIKLGDELLIA